MHNSIIFVACNSSRTTYEEGIANHILYLAGFLLENITRGGAKQNIVKLLGGD